MYIIKAAHPVTDTTLYWTARRGQRGWSMFPERAHQYKTAKGACSALRRNKAKQQKTEDLQRAWRSAYVATSIGVW